MKLGITNKKTNKTIEDYKNDFKLIKEAGFDSVDFQNFVRSNSNLYSLSEEEFESFMIKIKEEADHLNLTINQLHSYWECPPVMDFNEDTLYKQIDYYKKSILGAKLLGTKYVVLHHRFPFGLEKEINENNKEDFIRINVEFLTKLEKYARECDVILCLENLPFDITGCSVDTTLKIVNLVNSDYVKMCFDIGHANVLKDNIYEDILKIGNKLACLHVHDNLCDHDSHLYPYQGNINWDEVIKGLNEIKYTGVFSFETAPGDELEESIRLEGLKYLKKLGEKIVKRSL